LVTGSTVILFSGLATDLSPPWRGVAGALMLGTCLAWFLFAVSGALVEVVRPTGAAHWTGTTRVKRGMAEMLKGGVIMDVVTPEQAKIAEDAGAVAVMALERVPADIRAQGGVSRMSDPDMIDGIIAAVSIPVMAKARIGHFRRGAGAAEPRRRLHRRVRGAHAGRLRQPHRQVGIPRAVRLRRHQPRRGPAPDHRGRGDDPFQGRGRHR
jgi:hypothetical protein